MRYWPHHLPSGNQKRFWRDPAKWEMRIIDISKQG